MGNIGEPERIIEILPLEEPVAVPADPEPSGVPIDPEPNEVPVDPRPAQVPT